jgi:hypothetical protein
MHITKAQRWKILELWTKVCKDRGWKTSDRSLRLATIGGFLNRELRSLDDVGRLDECTKVLAELEAMLGVSLRAGLEATDPSRNRKRNWKWLIANETLPCLAIYPNEANPDVPMGDVGAYGYLVRVMEGKSRYRKTDRPESEPSLEDFDARTVEQIYWTLNARLNDKRKAAGHSGHEMCLAAGIPCKCAKCRRERAGVVAGPLVAPLPVGTDSQVETAEILTEEGNANPF